MISSISSVREAASSRADRPSPYRSRCCGPAHPDARVDRRGGDRPGAGGVVLDDRDPPLGRPGRRSVVDLDAGQDPGKVAPCQVVDGARGRRAR